MPKKFKGENSRVTKAKAIKAKAANDKKRKADAAEARKEAEEWKTGSNRRAAAKKEADEKKRIEKEAKRQLRKLQEEEEAAELAKLRKTKKEKRTKLKAPTRRIPGTGAGAGAGSSAGGSTGARSRTGSVNSGFSGFSGNGSETSTLNAMDIDSALNALESTAPSTGGELDRHPERRMKSAYAVYFERESARLKADNPSLRLSQIKNKVYKSWKKSPENPMNQEHLAYNAKK